VGASPVEIEPALDTATVQHQAGGSNPSRGNPFKTVSHVISHQKNPLGW
jgi:hypothetical protein